MNKRIKIPVILVAALLLSAGITLCVSLHTTVSASDKIQYDQEEIESIVESDGKVTVIFSDQDQEDYGRYVGRLAVKLSGQTEKPMRIMATVWTHDPKQQNTMQKTLELTDVNPIYVSEEILRIDCENVVSIDLESVGEGRLLFHEIRIDNAFHFGRYLFLACFVTISVLLFLALQLFETVRKNLRQEPEKLCTRAFLLLSLSVGILLSICLPLNKVGYDEETHLQAVVQLASFPSNELHISEVLMRQLTVTEYNNPEAQPGGEAEQNEFSAYLTEHSDYKNGERSPKFHVPAGRIPAYLSMAVLCKAGKGLGLGWNTILFLIRIANLITYTALVYAALKVTPCGHALMLLVGLLPQNLFLASTVSYDPFITGMLLVSMAFFLKMMEGSCEGDRINAIQLAGFLLPLILGCLIKVVYAPLLMTALLIPLRKHESKKKTVFLTVSVLAAFFLLVLIFIVPTLIAPSVSGDVRGGEVSERAQLSFILSEPLTYTGILLLQMIRWIPQCLLGPDCTTFMGHLVNGTTAYKGSWILILLLLTGLVITGNVRVLMERVRSFLKTEEKIWILLMCFGSSCLIWTAMYLTFTTPGASEIAGVQGRYFIPLLFPVYFALGAQEPAGAVMEVKAAEEKPGLAELVRNGSLWYYLFILGLAAALFVQLFKAVILPYCL